MVRLAIAGSGGMANYHAKKFSSLHNCVLSACKDHVALHAQQFAADHNIPLWFDNLQNLIDSRSSNAFSCAVVDWRHKDLCIGAMEGNLAVFCEKPMVRTIAEARQMADTAEKSRVPTFVNFSKRNASALHAMRQLVEQKALGTLQQVSISYLQGWVATGMWGDWRVVPRWKWRLMGDKGTAGVVGDLGSHLIDALLFIFGELSNVSIDSALDLIEADAGGLLGDLHPTDEFTQGLAAYVAVSAHAQVADDVPCTIAMSLIDTGATDDFSITIEGSEATARLDLRRSRTDVELSNHVTGTKKLITFPVIPSTYEQFCNLVAQQSYRPDLGPLPDFTYGLKVQHLLDDLAPGGLPS